MERGLLPTGAPPLLPPALPLVGGMAGAGVRAGLALGQDCSIPRVPAKSGTHRICYHIPITSGGQGPIFGGRARMCTPVCSLPATLSHLGHPSGGDSCWQCPGPICRVVALLLTTASTYPGGHTERSLQQHASPGGVTSAFPWPPAPPVALRHLRPLCPYQAGRARCGAGSLPQPTTLPVLPGHAAPVCSACCPPPVGAWGQGSGGVCPPPALGEHCRWSPCCPARQCGCVGVSPVPGGLRLCQGQRDPTWAPLIPNPLS